MYDKEDSETESKKTVAYMQEVLKEEFTERSEDKHSEEVEGRRK